MTKGKLTSFAAASMLMAATTLAQSQSSSGAAPAQPAASAANKITVTGCVERADQFNSTGSSNVGTSVDSLDFVLIKADEMPASASTAAGSTASDRSANNSATPSAVGTSGSTATPIYRLESTVEKLNPHVGHKVEVIGTREASAGATTHAADATNPSTATAPRLMVESVKMLAESCNR